jgi:hypothetical protein
VRYLSAVITLLMLIGLYAQAMARPSATMAQPYHERIRALSETIPMSVGSWNGSDNTATVPSAAIKMLRPNVLIGRSYRNDETGVRANLVFVQCTDSREMGGHYPPRCYPTQGWTIAPGQEASVERDDTPGVPRDMKAGDRRIPVRVYEFRQRAFPKDRAVRIYSFFVIPTRGIATTLKPVREAAADYALRPFGVAQIQVVVDGAVSEEAASDAFDALVQQILPLIDMVDHTSEEVHKSTTGALPRGRESGWTA